MNKTISLTLLSALFLSAPVFAGHHGADHEIKAMESLFNGKDLTGWSGDSKYWSVKDGVIHGTTHEQRPTAIPSSSIRVRMSAIFTSALKHVVWITTPA
jgi:hypothetical protein